MGLLSCQCANVSIYTTSHEEVLTELASSVSLEALAQADPFFNHVSLQRFGLGGVHMVQALLTSKREVEGWSVHRCLNCQMDLYATQDSQPAPPALQLDASQLLAATSLACTEADHRRIREKASYSAQFKLCIDRHSHPTALPSDAESGELASVLTDLEMKMKDSLDWERHALEDRVRQYKEQQLAAYHALAVRVEEDKVALYYRVRAAYKEIKDNQSKNSNAEHGSQSLAAATDQERQDTMCLSNQAVQPMETVLLPKAPEMTAESEIDGQIESGHDIKPSNQKTLESSKITRKGQSVHFAPGVSSSSPPKRRSQSSDDDLIDLPMEDDIFFAMDDQSDTPSKARTPLAVPDFEQIPSADRHKTQTTDSISLFSTSIPIEIPLDSRALRLPQDLSSEVSPAGAMDSATISKSMQALSLARTLPDDEIKALQDVFYTRKFSVV